MDSSYFLIFNSTTTTANASSNINDDLEQSSSSSSFNYDPFDGFNSSIDQPASRFYDYFGVGGDGTDRASPLISQCSIDQLDQLQQKIFPFPTDPNQEDNDDLQGTLVSFEGDLGVDSDAGYNSGVDLFSANNIFDRTDATEAAYLTCDAYSTTNDNNYTDVNDYNNNINYNNHSNSNGDRNTKRSVLMNLLINGSDVDAGYTSLVQTTGQARETSGYSERVGWIGH